MRSHAATALVALTVGLAASAVARRLGRRRPMTTAVDAPAPTGADLDREAVVLAFTRKPVARTTSERPATPARCGDSGGRTKAGAPCGSRATLGGRCHHHPMAA
jgi:hypothetical protein